MQQTAQVLTTLINNSFDRAFANEFIAVLVLDQPELTVLIRLNTQPYSNASYNPFPDYSSDSTIFAKALRVLVNLEFQFPFYDFLETNRIQKILVTSASHPSLMNNSNKWVFTIKDSKYEVLRLVGLKRMDEELFEDRFLKAVLK